MTTLLAIDASTTAVGWAVFVDGNYENSGVFRPQGKDAWKRIGHYEQWLRDFLAYAGHRMIAYEIASGRHGNIRTDRILGALEYVTRNQASNFKAALMPVAPSQVRASGCHKKAKHIASAIAGKEITSGDEADAIGVALAALAKMGV